MAKQTEKKVEQKKNNGLNWLLWWQVDQDELKQQVTEYNTLGITKSSRGVAALCLLFSVVVTSVLILLNLLNVAAFIDVSLFALFAFFIHKGHKWAMIGAMILWSVEKLFMIVSGEGSPFISLIWWTTYMHAFWMAFKVEQAREKKT
jgi:hypothetical protein